MWLVIETNCEDCGAEMFVTAFATKDAAAGYKPKDAGSQTCGRVRVVAVPAIGDTVKAEHGR